MSEMSTIFLFTKQLNLVSQVFLVTVPFKPVADYIFDVISSINTNSSKFGHQFTTNYGELYVCF